MDRKTLGWAVFSLLLLVLTVRAPAQSSFVGQITGNWQGEGTLMGAPATFEMQWEEELGGQFIKLTFASKRESANGQTAEFGAIAYYNLQSDSDWKGTWFDSRGISFPVQGKLSESVLTVEWGSPEIEQGRTVYALETGGEMLVTDYVLRDGSYVKFGEARYRRTPSGK